MMHSFCIRHQGARLSIEHQVSGTIIRNRCIGPGPVPEVMHRLRKDARHVVSSAAHSQCPRGVVSAGIGYTANATFSTPD
jgi:hypothetical protein